jgi:demethylmenaquinone methyltransferase / 2-methoxy-6-polyprenyl-1,4-benzoquinol methylase
MAANLSKLETVQRFFSGTGFSYDQVALLCTLGFDRLWKKKIINKIPRRPRRILDQASGTGILTFEIARRFPDCEVIGVELRGEYLSIAKEKARAWRIGNVRFILGRAEEVVPDGAFDCIASSYLAKYADLKTLLAQAGRMLRPGGLIIMHDFTYPPHSLFRSGWQTYLAILRLLGTKIYPEWRTAFYELPGFLRETRWLTESIALLTEQGFRNLEVEALTFGTSAIVTARKPAGPPR